MGQDTVQVFAHARETCPFSVVVMCHAPARQRCRRRGVAGLFAALLAPPWRVEEDIRLPGKENSNFHGSRPVRVQRLGLRVRVQGLGLGCGIWGLDAFLVCKRLTLSHCTLTLSQTTKEYIPKGIHPKDFWYQTRFCKPTRELKKGSKPDAMLKRNVFGTSAK